MLLVVFVYIIREGKSMYEIVYVKNDKETIKVEVESNRDYFYIMDKIIESYVDKIRILSVKYK